MAGIEVERFANTDRGARARLRAFVDFHRSHYRDDPRYIPLLDYEYLGFRMLGIVGYFEPRSLFLQHAEIAFFMAYDGRRQPVGRCIAFVNDDHNAHWNEKTGFFGFFESVDDQEVTDRLLRAAGDWLRERGMQTMRGPQNLPVNQATPGVLTEGLDSRPVIYYHYNKPCYLDLLTAAGLRPVKRVRSWEVPVDVPMEAKLQRVAEIVQKRGGVVFETWAERPLAERKREMLDIYNDAWNDNWGFVPYRAEEFFKVIDDEQLIVDRGQFSIAYCRGEPAAFFGAVPNILDRLRPSRLFPRFELWRAARMLLTKGSITGMRFGYLGVKKQFRNRGLEGLLLWKQKIYTQRHGYEYCDVGYVLEDNAPVLTMLDMMNAVPSKTYTILEMPL
ncbi:MAG: hypothetical protein OXC31_07545 [Spirochaetaceae bacterium]|nr:hypothetical protein [Spirochaetaceae bacterium]